MTAWMRIGGVFVALLIVAGIFAVINGWRGDAARLPVIQHQLKEANTETEVANANTESVVSMYEERGAALQRAQRLAQQRRVMAQQATQQLAGYLTAADYPAINARLCEQLGRIQGSPVAGCGAEVLDTGAPGAGSDHAPFAIITKATVTATESALHQCADYIDMTQPEASQPPQKSGG